MSGGSNVYSEVYAFLNLLGEDYIKKIPAGMYELFSTKRNMHYELHIDINKNIPEQFKHDETLVIISALNLYFFCNDEERKRLIQIYTENDEKFSSKSFEEKVNNDTMNNLNENGISVNKRNEQNINALNDNILNNNLIQANQQTQQNKLEILPKENIFKRILKKIKSIFKR